MLRTEIGEDTFPDTNAQKVGYRKERVKISPAYFLDETMPNPKSAEIILTKRKGMEVRTGVPCPTGTAEVLSTDLWWRDFVST